MKSPISGCWLGYQDTPKPNISCCCCPWLSPEVGGKSLFLQTSWTLGTEPRGPELDLTWKPPSWGLAFTVPEGIKPLPKQGVNQQSTASTSISWPPGGCSSGMSLFVVRNSSLLGHMSHSTRENSCQYLKPSWQPRASKVKILEKNLQPHLH